MWYLCFLKVLQMQKELMALASKRKIRLQDCYQLQQFLFDSDEIRTWISEKTKTASDETYKVNPVTIIDCISSCSQ